VRALHSLPSEEYTTNQASVVTGVPVARINHYIARELSGLGVAVWGEGRRRLGYGGLIALRVAHDFPKSLTPGARIEAIEKALRFPRRKDIVLQDNVSVPVSLSKKRVAKGLRRLRQATSMVASDPRTLQGEPCFKGTRIPVRVVAGIAATGGIDSARLAYPRLTKAQIELACLYVQANPQRGRPRRVAEVLAKRKPRSTTTVSVTID
jgi:uncharacterized protein (DUF433 family)